MKSENIECFEKNALNKNIKHADCSTAAWTVTNSMSFPIDRLLTSLRLVMTSLLSLTRTSACIIFLIGYPIVFYHISVTIVSTSRPVSRPTSPIPSIWSKRARNFWRERHWPMYSKQRTRRLEDGDAMERMYGKLIWKYRLPWKVAW